MEERRAHQRGPARGSVDYQSSAQLRCEEIYDLSAGGMRLVLSGPEEAGREVRLRLHPDSGEELAIRARVVWARQKAPFQVGLRFLDVAAPFVGALRAR